MRAGIVGYGLAGRYVHGPTLVSAGFEVAAICARSLEKKALAHQDFPNAILVTSIEELVDEDLDLIVVASTNEVHAQHARSAIEAGIATVVDKPMGRNYYETLELFETADLHGVADFVGGEQQVVLDLLIQRRYFRIDIQFVLLNPIFCFPNFFVTF